MKFEGIENYSPIGPLTEVVAKTQAMLDKETERDEEEELMEQIDEEEEEEE